MGKWLAQFKGQTETPIGAGHPFALAAPLQDAPKPGSFLPERLLPDGMDGSGGEDRAAGANVARNSEAQRPKVARAQALTTGTPDECNALGATCRETIRRQGYCLIKSQALGETIAVVESEHHRNLAPAGSITYTLHELELLAEGYKAGHIVTIGDLRLMHSTKKKLGGVIIR